ncbi:MAG: NAD(P)H-dependent oxidoreductase [Dysosmobacter sp.]|nr:NAD(P)H-dependent oxidoreductase [Dysosmobacter sp.]
MKMSVLYHSKSGNTKAMAEAVAEGMEQVEAVEAKTMSIDAVDEEWLRESVCLVLGSPTYYASVSGEMKLFLEGLGKYGVAGKLGGAFATANYIHGGGELAIQTILDHLMVYGMLVYSGGGSKGKPVIHLGPEAVAGELEKSRETFLVYGRRMAEKAAELFG